MLLYTLRVLYTKFLLIILRKHNYTYNYSKIYISSI